MSEFKNFLNEMPYMNQDDFITCPYINHEGPLINGSLEYEHGDDFRYDICAEYLHENHFTRDAILAKREKYNIPNLGEEIIDITFTQSKLQEYLKRLQKGYPFVTTDKGRNGYIPILCRLDRKIFMYDATEKRAYAPEYDGDMLFCNVFKYLICNEPNEHFREDFDKLDVLSPTEQKN